MTMSPTPYFSSRATSSRALSTRARADLPYFCRCSRSMLPVLAPTRTGMPCARTQSATRRTAASPPMLPGLMRILSAPFSTESTARSAEKWISATIGTGERPRSARIARASASSRTATRTISQPAAYNLPICSSVRATSDVGVVVMDCTRTGAPPPSATPPIRTCFVLFLSILPLREREGSPRYSGFRSALSLLC